MSREVDLGQIVPNIQVGTTTTGSPSSQASVINVGTDLNPILNFTIPKGDSGSIKFIIVETLPSENIDESAIYLTPSENPDLKNHYDEWIWVTDRFEPLGETQIEVDLTDYVKNTDYATNAKGGVLKTGNGTYLDGNGIIVPSEYSMSSYNDRGRNTFISKGTLENVITGKGLVSNTTFPTTTTGGVVINNSTYGASVNSSGIIYALSRTYEQYESLPINYIISKGTLDNVIIGKGLVSNTDYATGSVGGVIKTPSTLGISVGATGNVFALTSTYEQYGDRPPGYFIGKATLDNVLDAKIGDIQTLLDNLDVGSGV